MLSLLRQRASTRLGASSTTSLFQIRAAINRGELSARRSFLTSTPDCAPAATPKKASATKEAGAKKAVSKDANPEEASAEEAAKPKRKATTKKTETDAAKKPEVETPEKPAPIKLTKDDMPPKSPRNPYLVFFTKYLNGLSDAHKPKSAQELNVTAKDCANMWRNFTFAEKQPFADDYERAKALYVIERQNYFEKVPVATLREINRLRKAKGLKSIRRKTSRPRRPTSSFFRFAAEFRSSPEGLKIRQAYPGSTSIPHLGKAAGEKWRTMDEEAKKPYVEEAKKELDAYHQAKAAQ